MKSLRNAINAILSPVTSMETVVLDVAHAKRADNNARLAGVKQTTAFKVIGRFKAAPRKLIKQLAIDSVKSVMAGGEPTLLANLPLLKQEHDIMQSKLFEIRENVVRWDGMSVDLPFYQLYTYLNRDTNDDPIFEIDELWSYEEFVNFVTNSVKFKKDTAKWMIADQLENESCPILSLTSDFGESVWEKVLRSLDARRERDIEDEKDGWDYEGFYLSGKTFGELAEYPSLTSALAFIGRVVGMYNSSVRAVNYRIGNQLHDENPRAGMEKGDSEFEVLSYVLSISSSRNEQRYIVEDAEYRNLQAEIEETAETIEQWVDAWKAILPEAVLQAIDMFYHGGYQFMGEKDGKPTFKLKKFEFVQLDREMSQEMYLMEKDEKTAAAIEADNRALDEYILRNA